MMQFCGAEKSTWAVLTGVVLSTIVLVRLYDRAMISDIATIASHSDNEVYIVQDTPPATPPILFKDHEDVATFSIAAQPKTLVDDSKGRTYTKAAQDGPVTLEHLGCYQIKLADHHISFLKKIPMLSPSVCADQCASQGYKYVGLLTETQCWCSDQLPTDPDSNNESECILPCPNLPSVMCGGRNWYSNIYEITSELREPLTVYVAPAKRTSSLFSTGRFIKYFSDKYVYRAKTFNAQITRTDRRFYEEVCIQNPGKKIFVQIAGAVEYILSHFPDHSILVITGDEVGNWGLGDDRKRIGPHGDNAAFKSNETSQFKHIILPRKVVPFFKQYYDFKQKAAFGNDVNVIPLGSRNEYNNIAPEEIKPSTKRKYIYSYMVAITDAVRGKLHRLLINDTSIPEPKRFIQVSQHWHGNAQNSEYVSPERYREIMIDSVFALCPKGHSVEQFRIYEALEAGAIPVLELAAGYLAKHIDPEYLNSPMLLVESWEDVIPEMLKLVSDPVKLAKRQTELLQWYDRMMRSKALHMEQVLDTKISNEFCENNKHLLEV